MTAPVHVISSSSNRSARAIEPSWWTRMLHAWPAGVLAFAGVITVAWIMALGWGLESVIETLF